MRFVQAGLTMSVGLVLACSTGAEDGRNATGSQALSTSHDFSALYVANADEDAISRVDIANGQRSVLEIGGAPTRITRIGDRVLVTLRSERTIAVLKDEGGTLTEVERINVGAEPFGIVATEDGTRVYVAISMEDKVLELDGQTLKTLRSWAVPDQPRWLAVHPSGNALYVGSALRGTLSWISLENSVGANALPIELPVVTKFNFDFEFGSQEIVPLSPRITGDLAISPDGKNVVVPMILVDNTTLVKEIEEGDPRDPVGPPSGGYGGSDGELGTMNPVVTLVAAKRNGAPNVDKVTLSQLNNFEISSYPAAVTISPDSKHIVVALEGASRVAVLPMKAEGPVLFFDAPEADGLFERRSIEMVGTDAGPRAVVFSEDKTAHVYSFIDRSVAKIDLTPVRDRLDDQEDFFGEGPRAVAFPEIGIPGEPRGPVAPAEFNAFDTVKVVDATLPPELERGRRLFYSTIDPKITTPGAGISCSTCHFDSRNDGLTWRFESGLRQTPSLAGVVSARAPVRWRGEQPSVADDALFTSSKLMGGQSLNRTEAEAIQAYVDFTRPVDIALRGQVNEKIDLGRSIFFREDVGCGSCHSGALLSDLQTYDLLGLQGVKTPSLVGLASTPPYFHDGSAPTLRDVLDRVRDGSMGNTSMLNEPEMEALETYLKSL